MKKFCITFILLVIMSLSVVHVSASSNNPCRGTYDATTQTLTITSASNITQQNLDDLIAEQPGAVKEIYFQTSISLTGNVRFNIPVTLSKPCNISDSDYTVTFAEGINLNNQAITCRSDISILKGGCFFNSTSISRLYKNIYIKGDITVEGFGLQIVENKNITYTRRIEGDVICNCTRNDSSYRTQLVDTVITGNIYSRFANTYTYFTRCTVNGNVDIQAATFTVYLTDCIINGNVTVACPTYNLQSKYGTLKETTSVTTPPVYNTKLKGLVYLQQSSKDANCIISGDCTSVLCNIRFSNYSTNPIQIKRNLFMEDSSMSGCVSIVRDTDILFTNYYSNRSSSYSGSSSTTGPLVEGTISVGGTLNVLSEKDSNQYNTYNRYSDGSSSTAFSPFTATIISVGGDVNVNGTKSPLTIVKTGSSSNWDTYETQLHESGYIGSVQGTVNLTNVTDSKIQGNIKGNITLVNSNIRFTSLSGQGYPLLFGDIIALWDVNTQLKGVLQPSITGRVQGVSNVQCKIQNYASSCAFTYSLQSTTPYTANLIGENNKSCALTASNSFTVAADNAAHYISVSSMQITCTSNVSLKALHLIASSMTTSHTGQTWGDNGYEYYTIWDTLNVEGPFILDKDCIVNTRIPSFTSKDTIAGTINSNGSAITIGDNTGASNAVFQGKLNVTGSNTFSNCTFSDVSTFDGDTIFNSCVAKNTCTFNSTAKINNSQLASGIFKSNSIISASTLSGSGNFNAPATLTNTTVMSGVVFNEPSRGSTIDKGTFTGNPACNGSSYVTVRRGTFNDNSASRRSSFLLHDDSELVQSGSSSATVKLSNPPVVIDWGSFPVSDKELEKMATKRQEFLDKPISEILCL